MSGVEIPIEQLRETAAALGVDPEKLSRSELTAEIGRVESERLAEREARERHEAIARRAGRPLVDVPVKELRVIASEFDVSTSGSKAELITALGHDPEEMDEAARVKATAALVKAENRTAEKLAAERETKRDRLSMLALATALAGGPVHEQETDVLRQLAEDLGLESKGGRKALLDRLGHRDAE